jgi:uracil-DNA glycosylase family 4
MFAKREKLMTIGWSCYDCGLHRTRRKIVWGRGAMPADLLFMGEAPGRVEDLRGLPFVGPSGKLLDLMIAEAALRTGVEEPSYYITNAVLCHPTERIGGDDRQPTPAEVAACTDNVMKLVKLVNPAMVVFVGKVAERYYGKEFPVHNSILHPAYLVRQGGTASPNYMTTVRKLQDIFMEVRNAA